MYLRVSRVNFLATLTEVFSMLFSLSCKTNARLNLQRRGTARTLPNFCVVLCIVCFVSFSVLFVCICVLYYCHRVATQLQLNISYHISWMKRKIQSNFTEQIVSKASIKNRTLAFYRMFHVFWHREEMCYFMICVLHSLHFSLYTPVSESSSAITLFQYVTCHHRECFSDRSCWWASLPLFCKYITFLSWPHKTKYKGHKSGDLGGHSYDPRLPFRWFGKCWFNQSRTSTG